MSISPGRLFLRRNSARWPGFVPRHSRAGEVRRGRAQEPQRASLGHPLDRGGGMDDGDTVDLAPLLSAYRERPAKHHGRRSATDEVASPSIHLGRRGQTPEFFPFDSLAPWLNVNLSRFEQLTALGLNVSSGVANRRLRESRRWVHAPQPVLQPPAAVRSGRGRAARAPPA